MHYELKSQIVTQNGHLQHAHSPQPRSHSSIELHNTSTGKYAAAFRRDRFKLSILGCLYLQAISWSFGPEFLVQEV